MSTTESPERRSDQLIEQTLMHEAVDLLLACLASIPPEKINPKQYWDHAQKSIQIGAQRGTTIERMVSEMHGQLGIEQAFTARSSSKIYSICETITARGDYQRFRAICRKQAPYVVVLARVTKEQRKQNEDQSGWLRPPETNNQ